MTVVVEGARLVTTFDPRTLRFSRSHPAASVEGSLRRTAGAVALNMELTIPDSCTYTITGTRSGPLPAATSSTLNTGALTATTAPSGLAAAGREDSEGSSGGVSGVLIGALALGGVAGVSVLATTGRRRTRRLGRALASACADRIAAVRALQECEATLRGFDAELASRRRRVYADQWSAQLTTLTATAISPVAATLFSGSAPGARVRPDRRGDRRACGPRRSS